MLSNADPIRARYDIGSTVRVYLKDKNGFLFNFTTLAFETFTGDASQFSAPVPEVTPGQFQMPFPAAITLPGRYNAYLIKTTSIYYSLNTPSSTRKYFVAGPSEGSAIRHYGATQPPYGARPDIFAFTHRTLLGAWPMTGGDVPINALKPEVRHLPEFRPSYLAAEINGEACALVAGAPDGTTTIRRGDYPNVSSFGWGYPLWLRCSPRGAFTVLASIQPVSGETGPILSYGFLCLSKLASGYRLQFYTDTGGLSTHDFPQVPDGEHRWAITLRSAFPDNGLRVYCDGALIHADPNVYLGSISSPSYLNTALWMGSLGNYDPSTAPDGSTEFTAPTCTKITKCMGADFHRVKSPLTSPSRTIYIFGQTHTGRRASAAVAVRA